MPVGVYGTVTDVQIFSREGTERDSRYSAIIDKTLADYVKTRKEQYELSLSQIKQHLIAVVQAQARDLTIGDKA